jgi:DNA-binding NarL/FixJ family response regulator
MFGGAMTESNKPIRVLLISEYGFTASELELNLAAHVDEVEFIGAANSGQEGIDKVLDWSPDVVLISAYIPDMHTDEVVRVLRDAHPRLHIITASHSNNPQFIIGTLDSGADDYVCLPLYGDDLFNSIQRFHHRTSPSLKEHIERQRRESGVP